MEKHQIFSIIATPHHKVKCLLEPRGRKERVEHREAGGALHQGPDTSIPPLQYIS